MDALLSDINQAGISRGLKFTLFKPMTKVVKQYYAELPISIEVVGKYNEIGNFISDVANMPRIVTFEDIQLTPSDDENLTLRTTAKTFRYLNKSEIQSEDDGKSKSKRRTRK